MRIPLRDKEEAGGTVTVTAAGRENLVLRAFVRQAVQMLRSPEAFPRPQRLQLAGSLERALDDGADAPPEEGYEPGMDG